MTAGRGLRVGLNLVFLGERAGGAGRYARQLPGALLEAEPDTSVEVFVSADAPPDLSEEAWAPAVRWTRLPVRLSGPPLHLAAQIALLPAIAAARRLDVLHSPANVGIAGWGRTASVVSLLDLIWWHRPTQWEASPRAQRAMRRLTLGGLRRADRVLAISHTAATDLVESLGLDPARVDVTPLGVAPPRRGAATAEQEALRIRLDLGERPVIACVAQKRPYKNLHRLIRAMSGLRGDPVLVLPGAPTPYEAELRALVVELGLETRVRFPDWLSDIELEALYAVTSVFVLPSLVEGFGLPILEAMVRGVPVCCSNVSALPEVAGDAALLFDPERVGEIAGAVQTVLTDAALAARLREAGRRRAAELSWRRTGTATLVGYRRAIADRRGSSGPGRP